MTDEASKRRGRAAAHAPYQRREHETLGPDRPRELAAVVRQIVERFLPERILLFGSYAYGTPRPESDVDLLVVMDTPRSEVQQAALICQSIDYHFGLDLIVRTPAALARRLAQGDPFLREVVERGQVLYERPSR